MTKDVADRLRANGLAYVCILNGRYVGSDLRPLPPEVEMRVQEIVTGEVTEYSPPDESPAPVHKNKGGRPKGAKDSFKRTRHRK